MKFRKCKSGRKPFSAFAISIILVLLCNNPIIGQAQFGIKSGITSSNFYYSGSPRPFNDYDIDLRPYLGYDVVLNQTAPQKPLFSYYLSIYRSFPITEKIGLRPEISFTQKGVNFSQFDYEKYIYKVKITYLEIPLSVTYQLMKKEKSLMDIYMGAFGAFKLKAIKKVAINDSPTDNIKINSVNIFDWGFHLGTAYKYKLFNNFVLMDFRVFIGMENIFSQPSQWTSIYYETQKTRLTGINLSLGYEF